MHMDTIINLDLITKNLNYYKGNIVTSVISMLVISVVDGGSISTLLLLLCWYEATSM